PRHATPALFPYTPLFRSYPLVALCTLGRRLSLAQQTGAGMDRLASVDGVDHPASALGALCHLDVDDLVQQDTVALDADVRGVSADPVAIDRGRVRRVHELALDLRVAQRCGCALKRVVAGANLLLFVEHAVHDHSERQRRARHDQHLPPVFVTLAADGGVRDGGAHVDAYLFHGRAFPG